MTQLGESGESLSTGIYYGYTNLKSIIYPAVISVGYNPYYNNTTKTVEAHLIHSTQLDDFYGKYICNI